LLPSIEGLSTFWCVDTQSEILTMMVEHCFSN
jgi:hypothetical protein